MIAIDTNWEHFAIKLLDNSLIKLQSIRYKLLYRIYNSLYS